MKTLSTSLIVPIRYGGIVKKHTRYDGMPVSSKSTLGPEKNSETFKCLSRVSDKAERCQKAPKASGNN